MFASIMSVLMLPLFQAATPQSPSNAVELPVPRLMDAAMPLYHTLAREAAVQGTVEIEATIRGDRVAEMTIREGSGIPFLPQLASENLRTWRFFTVDAPSTIIVSFHYEIDPNPTHYPENPVIALDMENWSFTIRVRQSICPVPNFQDCEERWKNRTSP